MNAADDATCERVAATGNTISAGAVAAEGWAVRARHEAEPDRGYVASDGSTVSAFLSLEQFAAHSRDSIWVADARSGVFHCLNPIARKWWVGANPAATLNEWRHRVHPLDQARVAEQRERVRAGEPQRLSYRLVDGAVIRRFREASFMIPGQEDGEGSIAGIAEYLADDLPMYFLGAAGGDPLLAMLVEAGCRVTNIQAGEIQRFGANLQIGCLCIDARSHEAAVQAALPLLELPSLPSALVIGSGAVPSARMEAVLRDRRIRYIGWPAPASVIGHVIDALRLTLTDGSYGEVFSPGPAERIRSLSPRERQVLAGLLRGGSNKGIARELGISPRTVEVHRAHLMDRLGAPNLPTLLRMAITAGDQELA